MIYYEYDEEKNQTNIQKHKISFEEAITIFQDPYLKIASDDNSSEERFLAIGRSNKNRELLVVHCYRIKKDQEIIRIISARKLTLRERHEFEK